MSRSIRGMPMLDPNIDSFLNGVLSKGRSLGIDDLIEFDRFSRQAEGQSRSTVELSTLSLNKLKDFLTENDLPTDILRIGTAELRGFIFHLQGVRRFEHHMYTRSQEGTLSGLAIDAYLRSLRSSFNRAVADGLLGASPFAQIRLPRPPQKLIPALSERQLGAFFSAIERDTPAGSRDYALFLLYSDSMCRLSEVTNAALEDLNLQERTLRVVGKGNRQRLVPFGLRVQKAVWRYVKLHRPEPAFHNCDYIFLTRDGRPLTNNRVQMIMKRYAQRAQMVGVRCSPHVLRHTACVMWLRNGGDIFSLQRITGHRSLEVLKGYLNLAQSDVDSAHRRYSPIDNLGLGLSTRQQRDRSCRRRTDT